MPETQAKILVVDDEASITEFVSYNLRKEGYDVAVAATGDEALALAKDHPFDLVVLDVMLPGIDGYEVCRRLRADSSVPVLFLSARDTELDKVVGLEIGGDDYLAKPFGVRELQARVKALLRRAPSGAREPGVAGEHIELAGPAESMATTSSTGRVCGAVVSLMAATLGVTPDTGLLDFCAPPGGQPRRQSQGKKSDV